MVIDDKNVKNVDVKFIWIKMILYIGQKKKQKVMQSTHRIKGEF